MRIHVIHSTPKICCDASTKKNGIEWSRLSLGRLDSFRMHFWFLVLKPNPNPKSGFELYNTFCSTRVRRMEIICTYVNKWKTELLMTNNEFTNLHKDGLYYDYG